MTSQFSRVTWMFMFSNQSDTGFSMYSRHAYCGLRILAESEMDSSAPAFETAFRYLDSKTRVVIPRGRWKLSDVEDTWISVVYFREEPDAFLEGHFVLEGKSLKAVLELYNQRMAKSPKDSEFFYYDASLDKGVGRNFKNSRFFGKTRCAHGLSWDFSIDKNQKKLISPEKRITERVLTLKSSLNSIFCDPAKKRSFLKNNWLFYTNIHNKFLDSELLVVVGYLFLAQDYISLCVSCKEHPETPSLRGTIRFEGSINSAAKLYNRFALDFQSLLDQFLEKTASAKLQEIYKSSAAATLSELGADLPGKTRTISRKKRKKKSDSTIC